MDDDQQMGDNKLVIPTKTSAWSEEERERATPEAAPPATPDWTPAFIPGSVTNINGWWCRILHVGQGEPGRYVILVEPERAVGRGSRGATRAHYRQLVRDVGKRKAREILAGMGKGKSVPAKEDAEPVTGDCADCHMTDADRARLET